MKYRILMTAVVSYVNGVIVTRALPWPTVVFGLLLIAVLVGVGFLAGRESSR